MYTKMMSTEGELEPQSRWTMCLTWPSREFQDPHPPWMTGAHLVTRFQLEGETPHFSVGGIMTSGVMFSVITENYIFQGMIPMHYWLRAYPGNWQFSEDDMDTIVQDFLHSDRSNSGSTSSAQTALVSCQRRVPQNPTVHAVVFIYPPYVDNGDLCTMPTVDLMPFIDALKEAFRKQLALSESQFNAVFKEHPYEPWTEGMRWKDDAEFDAQQPEDSPEEVARKEAFNTKVQAQKDKREIEYAVLHFVPGRTPHVDVYEGQIDSTKPAALQIHLPVQRA